MAKKDVLFLDACVRGPRSRTLQLANRFLERLPNAEIRRVRLDTLGLLPLDRERLLTRDRLLREGKTDDAFFDLAKEFRRAQWLVVAAPYWDLSFPSLLKLYFENVTCSGVTFSYDQSGRPVSLCNAERLVYITTAGGPIGENDHGFAYVRAVCEQFFGVRQSFCIAAEGLDVIGNHPEEILRKAETSFEAALADD